MLGYWALTSSGPVEQRLQIQLSADPTVAAASLVRPEHERCKEGGGQVLQIRGSILQSVVRPLTDGFAARVTVGSWI